MVPYDSVLLRACFSPLLAKPNESISKYYRKSSFCANFGRFYPNLGKTRFFPGKTAFVSFERSFTLTSCLKSEKSGGLNFIYKIKEVHLWAILG